MIPHVLRNLSELDIENLQCGRITAQTMHEAAGRLIPIYANSIHVGSRGELYTTEERRLADELNDMLEAARKMREANGGWVSVEKLTEQAQELDMGYDDFPARENEPIQENKFQAGGTGF